MNKLFLLGKVYALQSLGIGKMLHAKDPAAKRKSLLMGVGFAFLAVLLVAMSAAYSVGMGSWPPWWGGRSWC